MGIPMEIPVGMGWVWGLKCHPHGSPANLVSVCRELSDIHEKPCPCVAELGINLYITGHMDLMMPNI